MLRHALLVMAILASTLGCRAAQEPAAVPAEFHGHWTTSDPRYEARAFELTVDTITLLNGEEGKASYPVQKFERIQKDGAIVHTLTYGNPVEGTTEALSFYYEPREGGVIRFKSQRNIEWKKGSGS
jgi:hypothetical protein